MATIVETYKKDLAFKSDFVLTPTGDFDYVEGFANVKDALFRRLITVPGTIVHRPTYGVGIKNFQNGITSITKQREIANKIDEQFRQDPRVQEVTGVSITSRDKTPEKIEILVRVKLVGYGEASLNFLPFGSAT